jgi:hypothetical protein
VLDEPRKPTRWSNDATSNEQSPSRSLARDVANALYDPTLELVWVEGESLRVVDLRVPSAEPIVIVREWPGTSFLSISHPASLVSSNDTCDVGDLASLTWNENPKLERIAEQSSELPLESKDWLRAQLKRPARASADGDYSLRTSESRIELPPDVWRCDASDDECGRVVRFGAHDLELVLAASRANECCLRRIRIAVWRRTCARCFGTDPTPALAQTMEAELGARRAAEGTLAD